MNKNLFPLLVELDEWLEQENLDFELEIIGGFALELHRVRIGRATDDMTQ